MEAALSPLFFEGAVAGDGAAEGTGDGAAVGAEVGAPEAVGAGLGSAATGVAAVPNRESARARESARDTSVGGQIWRALRRAS